MHSERLHLPSAPEYGRRFSERAGARERDREGERERKTERQRKTGRQKERERERGRERERTAPGLGGLLGGVSVLARQL